MTPLGIHLLLLAVFYGLIFFSIIHLELKRQKCSYALLLHSKNDARICEHKLSDAIYDVLTRLMVSNK